MLIFCLLILFSITNGAEYRQYGGTNNNKEKTTFGATGNFYIRGTFAGDSYREETSYALDGNKPVTTGMRGAREISNIVVGLKGSNTPLDDRLSLLHAIWGQFIMHDLIDTANGNESWPIAVSANDPEYGKFVDKIAFTRSKFDLGADGKRDQINLATAFLDASNIYGNSKSINGHIRVEGACELKVIDSQHGKILAKDNANIMDNDGNSKGKADQSTLFMAGDLRVNENSGLTAIHTLFVREHNRLCKKFEKGIKNVEERYQTARKWVTAFIQHITFTEYTAATLGNPLTPWTAYDDSINPSIDNFFAAASFKFGYSEMTSAIPYFDIDTQEKAGEIPLAENLFNPKFITENGIESIIMGMGRSLQGKIDPFFVPELRNFAFGRDPRKNSDNSIPIGTDVAAQAIQRARDHGIPRYNDLREYFGLTKKFEFSEITSDPQLAIALELAYPAGVDTIDSYIGALAEDKMGASHVGELITQSMREQFLRLRDGDRFYFENTEASGFTPQEIEIIKKTKLSDIIIRNTEIDNIQCSVFYAATTKEMLNCGTTQILPTQTNLLGDKEASIAFEEIGDDKVKFVVTAKHDGWIAVGIPKSQTAPRMLGSDVVIGYFHPTGDGIVEDYKIGDSIQDVACAEGVCYDTNTYIGGHDDIIGGTITKDGQYMTFQFTRLRNTNDTKGDIPFAKKGKDQVILLAMGKMAMMGKLGYHEHYKTFLTVGPNSLSEIAPVPKFEPTVDIDNKDSIKSQYQFSSPIAKIEGLTVYWTPRDNEIDIAVSGELEGYVSLGFTGGSGGMRGTNAVIGWAGKEPKVGVYFLPSYDLASIQESETLSISKTSAEIIDGKTVIKFTVPIDGKFVQPAGKLTEIIAAVCTDCYEIQEHTAHTSAPSTIDFGSGVLREAPFSWTLLHTHGILMTIAWGIMIPFGIIYARYGKDLGSNGLWFKIHQYVNSGAFLLSLGGVIISIVYFKGLKLDNVHAPIGLVITILGLAQIIYGLLRPHVPAKGEIKSMARIVFEVVHKWNGRILALAALANIGLGLYYIDVHLYFYIAFGAVLITISILMIILECRLRLANKGYEIADNSSPVKASDKVIPLDGYEKT